MPHRTPSSPFTTVGTNREDCGFLLNVRMLAKFASGSPTMFSSHFPSQRLRSRSFETCSLRGKEVDCNVPIWARQHTINRPLVVNAVHSSVRGLGLSSGVKTSNKPCCVSNRPGIRHLISCTDFSKPVMLTQIWLFLLKMVVICALPLSIFFLVISFRTSSMTA